MSKTFTDKAKKNYEIACKRNSEQHEFYFCGTSKNTTPRILDLDSPFVFCKPGKSGRKRNNLTEYKLEAFMIKAAFKETNRLLPIKDRKWLLLDAERNFAKDDLSEAGDGKRLDILAYDEEKRTYIVLELKKERNLRNKDNGAHGELLQYTRTIKNHIKKANEFYSVNAENVEGYIVWPSCNNPKENDTSWGLIEYDKEKLNDIENLQLNIVKKPN